MFSSFEKLPATTSLTPVSEVDLALFSFVPCQWHEFLQLPVCRPSMRAACLAPLHPSAYVLVFSHQFHRIFCLRCRHPGRSPLHQIMQFTVDVFIVNNTTDLPFLVIICHFSHLWGC